MGSLQPTGRSFGLCDLLPAVDNGARSLLLKLGSGRLAASTISGGFRQIRERVCGRLHKLNRVQRINTPYSRIPSIPRVPVIRLPQDFEQLHWSSKIEEAALPLIRLALQEDLNGQRDWSTWIATTHYLGSGGPMNAEPQEPADPNASLAKIVCRETGVVCGLKLLPIIQTELADYFRQVGNDAAATETQAGRWRLTGSDGDRVESGTVVARWEGPAATLLTMERTVLNFLGHLSGIATQTRHFVDAVTGTSTEIYDTRKTTPGWRLLDKYAVHCGGGRNHRLGLYSAVMLKDNHLATGTNTSLHSEGCASESSLIPEAKTASLATATATDPIPGPVAIDRLKSLIAHGRQLIQQARDSGELDSDLIFQVEVDSLAQLATVLQTDVDLILLDNMTLHELRQAVTMREASGRAIPLEASGGVTLANVAKVAGTGVDRISVGALTHSLTNLDLGLDWER